jgi:hypothetical protein
MTAKAREKINTDLESLEFYKFCDVYKTKFLKNQILLNKTSRRLAPATKLLAG